MNQQKNIKGNERGAQVLIVEVDPDQDPGTGRSVKRSKNQIPRKNAKRKRRGIEDRVPAVRVVRMNIEKVQK